MARPTKKDPKALHYLVKSDFLAVTALQWTTVSFDLPPEKKLDCFEHNHVFCFKLQCASIVVLLCTAIWWKSKDAVVHSVKMPIQVSLMINKVGFVDIKLIPFLIVATLRSV